MSLVKRPNSRYWYVQFQLQHRLVVRSTRTTDRRVAEKVAAKVRAEAHAELVLGVRKPLTVGDAVRRYVESKAGTANHRNLVSHSRSLLRDLNASLPLSQLSAKDLEEIRRKRAAQGRSAQTIKHTLNCLSAALSKAERDGYQVPALKMPAVKIANTRLRYLSAEEEQALLHQLDPSRSRRGLPPPSQRSEQQQQALQDNLDLVAILLDTGARYSEIANIRWRQIELAAGTIALWRSKVQNESVIFMTSRVAEILHRRASSRASEFVFARKDGRPRGYCSVAIRKAMDRAGLHDCTIHTLRHTHASRLIQHGLSVYEVKEVLGHSDIKTTMRYAHLEKAAVTAKARDAMEAYGRRR